MWDISFREMLVIQTIARLNSFSGAAQELGLSQSAISHTISNLEERLAIKLFTRLNGTVIPTKFAFPILKQFEGINKTISSAETDLIKSSNNIQEIKIQSGFRSNALWLAPAISSLLKNNISVTFDIRIDLKDCKKNLVSGNVDLVLSSLAFFLEESEFSKFRVGTYQNNFILNPTHSLANRKKVSIKDLKDYPLIGDPIFIGPDKELFKELGRWGFYDQQSNIFFPSIRLRSIREITHIIMETEAIGILPKILIKNDLEYKVLSLLNIDDHVENENEIYALYKKEKHDHEKFNYLLKALKEGI